MEKQKKSKSKQEWLGSNLKLRVLDDAMSSLYFSIRCLVTWFAAYNLIRI